VLLPVFLPGICPLLSCFWMREVTSPRHPSLPYLPITSPLFHINISLSLTILSSLPSSSLENLERASKRTQASSPLPPLSAQFRPSPLRSLTPQASAFFFFFSFYYFFFLFSGSSKRSSRRAQQPCTLARRARVNSSPHPRLLGEGESARTLAF